MYDYVIIFLLTFLCCCCFSCMSRLNDIREDIAQIKYNLMYQDYKENKDGKY